MSSEKKKIILSGIRPTGKLHLGHWVGALSNWIELQEEYKCFFMAADWHAFMSEYKNSSTIKKSIRDNISDWLAYGVNPEKSVVFIQSEVPEHLELYIILSALVPLGWLYRCPTFKEQVAQLKDKDINTHAFLGYPVLQSADILLYKANFVPVGEDQLPHLELCREIIRRFHFIYKRKVFIEPKGLLTSVPRFLGLDGRKMSKSYNNCIELCEEPESLKRKILSMFTDPARKKRNDPGHPDVCNVFDYYSIFGSVSGKSSKNLSEVKKECIEAKKGCRECKEELIKILEAFIAPHREEKKNILKKKHYLRNVLDEGAEYARKCARQTLNEVKEALKL
ncbi:MAG: tryptophan--tRNA ligase [Candidatus Omnitrophica bacterium]|nr:tryptophan--tRNA ligase [Candidatus Omnitrophota bacterium]